MGNFLRAIICFGVIIGVAFLLGKLDHHKHPEQCVYAYIVSGAVLFLTWGLL